MQGSATDGFIQGTIVDGAGDLIVNDIIAKNVINPDESNKAKAWVKEKGEYTFIDKVKVRLLASEDKYWAELVNFSYNLIHIPHQYIRKYETPGF